MGLKVFTNSKVKKPWYCSTESYAPAGIHIAASEGLARTPTYALRTSGKGTGLCCHLCYELRSCLYFGLNT